MLLLLLLFNVNQYSNITNRSVYYLNNLVLLREALHLKLLSYSR